MELHETHGFNIVLGEGRRSARRISSYNQGVVLTSRPVVPNKVLQVVHSLIQVFLNLHYICCAVAEEVISLGLNLTGAVGSNQHPMGILYNVGCDMPVS